MNWPILDAAQLEEWQFPPLVWEVEELWTKGSMVNISGPSQTGKTLLSLYIARALVEGGLLFDRFQVSPADKVLYLALEDPIRRLHARMLDTEFLAPLPGRLLLHPCSGLTLSNRNGMEYLQGLIESQHPGVVFLDTYQRATPGVGSFDDERQSKILHDLADLVRSQELTLVIIDHVRKGDSRKKKGLLTLEDIKGSQLKVANCDSVLLVQRVGQQLKIQCHCKDSETGERGFILDIGEPGRKPKFKYGGELGDFVSTSKEVGEKNRNRVLEVMRPGDWLACSEVARLANLADKTTRTHLSTLVDAGKVDVAGNYRWRRYSRIGQGPGELRDDVATSSNLSAGCIGQSDVD